MTHLPQLVREVLAAAGDAGKAGPMQSYMKSELPFRGVQAGDRRRVLAPLYAEHRLTDRADWVADVLDLWDHAAFREERYAAEALAGHRHYRAWQDPETLDLYRHLIVTGAWWDHVDNLATHHVGAILLSHREAVTPVLLAWSEGEDLWLRRTAILAQVNAREALDSGLLAAVITANLEGTRFGGEFFIRKAIGWALRQHARRDPLWVQSFVTTHADRLSDLSRREALKHR